MVGARPGRLTGRGNARHHPHDVDRGALGLLGKRVGQSVEGGNRACIGKDIVGFAKPAEALSWQQGNVDIARQRALRESRPLIVDFTAAWCGACKELDKLTFSAAPVGAELSRFVAVRVDATNDEDPKVGAALKRFGVRGLPTVVVFDSRGKEAIRFTDFVPPDQFLDGIKAVD